MAAVTVIPGCRTGPDDPASHPPWSPVTTSVPHSCRTSDMDGTWVWLLRSERGGPVPGPPRPGRVAGGPGPPRCEGAGVATPAGSHRGRERAAARARSRAAGAWLAVAGGTAGPVRRVRGPGTAGGLAAWPPAGASL